MGPQGPIGPSGPPGASVSLHVFFGTSLNYLVWLHFSEFKFISAYPELAQLSVKPLSEISFP